MSPAFEDFAVGPKLKLRLCWTNNPDTEDSAANSTTETSEICNSLTSMSNKENNNPDNNGVMKMSSTPKEDNNLQIIYQFLYSNNSRQQTEPHKDFYCPWCPKLDCLNLYALLKHLKLCHARFTFAYTVSYEENSSELVYMGYLMVCFCRKLPTELGLTWLWMKNTTVRISVHLEISPMVV